MRSWFHRRQWILLSSLLLVSAAFANLIAQTPTRPAVPEEARTAPLDQLTPVSPKVTVGQFANGFRYYIRENREPRERPLPTVRHYRLNNNGEP